MNRCLFFILLCAGTISMVGCGERGTTSERREGPRYGELMHEVGGRFELIGRAGAARRWELAEFELNELVEAFEELSGARQPEKTLGVDLAALQEAFLNTHPPELLTAVKGRDAAAFVSAFSRTAATCNGCHRATGHGFVEIPSEPGATVPRLDPVP